MKGKCNSIETQKKQIMNGNFKNISVPLFEVMPYLLVIGRSRNFRYIDLMRDKFLGMKISWETTKVICPFRLTVGFM